MDLEQEKFIDLETAADILFNLLPKEVLPEHDFAKEDFIEACKENSFSKTKFFTKEEVKRAILYLLSEQRQNKKKLTADTFIYLFI